MAESPPGMPKGLAELAEPTLRHAEGSGRAGRADPDVALSTPPGTAAGVGRTRRGGGRPGHQSIPGGLSPRSAGPGGTGRGRVQETSFTHRPRRGPAFEAVPAGGFGALPQRPAAPLRPGEPRPGEDGPGPRPVSREEAREGSAPRR